MTSRLRSILICPLPIFFAVGIYLGFASAPLRALPTFQPTISGQTEAGDDQFLIAQQEGVAKNPIGLAFTIRLKDNKEQFQQGETIRVELSFSSASPKRYELDGALYDRGGRLSIDRYCVDRLDDAVDPLKDLEPSSLGGMRSIPILEANPYLIVRDLNEYLRFDKTGKYRLYVVSDRVRREPSVKESTKQEGLIGVPATSNIIEFTVLPMNVEWANSQLQSAKKILESTDNLDPRRRDEEIQSADRVIRFLGTEDAVRYMIRHFDEAPNDFPFGLIGSPFRGTVVKEMENGLEAPDCAVSDQYLWVLSQCSYVQKYSRWGAPYPGTEDKAKLELWQKEEAKAQLARDAMHDGYVKRLAAAIANKNGRAKAVSLDALLNETKRRPSLSAEFIEKLPSELTQVFFDLPAGTQYFLLQYQWALIKNPALVPVLERYYENPLQKKGTYNPTIGGVALQRVYELDPKRGRDLILREIAHPTGRVQFEVLALLPDKTLPEMDDAFASALEKRQNDSFEQLPLQAKLLARYGTQAILPRVKAALLEKDSLWSCDVWAPVIAYCLRVDPAFGAAELEKVLSPELRAQMTCRGQVLGSVAALYACPELEAAAIHHLDDPDPEVVRNSVETLGKYGSAQAEAPLWKRFEKWHDEWKERAEELQVNRIPSYELATPLGMETAFCFALASARGWLTDAEKLKRIQSLCLTENMRRNVGVLISEAEASKKSLSFMSGPGDGWSVVVAQYRGLSSLDEVKAKLAQFPKGTVFSWSPFNAGPAEEQKKAMFEELKLFLAGLGMSLEEPQQPK
jgi:hypothetical protein